MPEVAIKHFDEPDEAVPLERAKMERVSVDGTAVWRATFEPGWRYSDHMGVGLCPDPHAAYIVSGALGFLMHDGTEVEAKAGSFIVVHAGHDAWTIGDEPCVFLDFIENVAQ